MVKAVFRVAESPATGVKGLIADDDASRKVLGYYKHGDLVIMEHVKGRSGPQHRLFFQLITTVYDNLPEGLHEQFPNKDVLRKYITGRCGYGDVITKDDQTYIVPASIAFDKMDQSEFNELFNAAVRFICDEIIPGLSAPELQAEVYSMVG